MLTPSEVSKSTTVAILLAQPAFNTTYRPPTVSFVIRVSQGPKNSVVLLPFSAKKDRARDRRANGRPLFPMARRQAAFTPTARAQEDSTRCLDVMCRKDAGQSASPLSPVHRTGPCYRFLTHV